MQVSSVWVAWLGSGRAYDTGRLGEPGLIAEESSQGVGGR